MYYELPRTTDARNCALLTRLLACLLAHHTPRGRSVSRSSRPRSTAIRSGEPTPCSPLAHISHALAPPPTHPPPSPSPLSGRLTSSSTTPPRSSQPPARSRMAQRVAASPATSPCARRPQHVNSQRRLGGATARHPGRLGGTAFGLGCPAHPGGAPPPPRSATATSTGCGRPPMPPSLIMRCSPLRCPAR